jgi:hypothetical protein
VRPWSCAVASTWSRSRARMPPSARRLTLGALGAASTALCSGGGMGHGGVDSLQLEIAAAVAGNALRAHHVAIASPMCCRSGAIPNAVPNKTIVVACVSARAWMQRAAAPSGENAPCSRGWRRHGSFPRGQAESRGHSVQIAWQSRYQVPWLPARVVRAPWASR